MARVTSTRLEHSPNSGLITGVDQAESPNHDDRPDGSVIDVIVVHAISLPPDCFGGSHVHDLFTNNLDVAFHPYFREICDLRVSSHFFIDRAGKTTQFVPTFRRAWHAGESEFNGREKVNDFSIGIELEGCDSLQFEEIQYVNLVHLAQCLRAAFPLIASNNIVGHSDISPGRKTDPGPCFNWERFLGKLD